MSNKNSDEKCLVCDCDRSQKVLFILTRERVSELGLSGDVEIPIEYNVIGEGAFKGRTDIRSVALHDSVFKIGKEAFSGCSNLKRITFVEELETVESRAFADCNSLSSSSRVRAKSVASDAYYITPRPRYTPPPRPEYTPPKRDTSPRVKTRTERARTEAPRTKRAKSGITRMAARVLLLGLVFLVLMAMISVIVPAVGEYEVNGFGAFLGAAILMLFGGSIYCKYRIADAKPFFNDAKIISLLLIFIVGYLNIVFKFSASKWIDSLWLIAILIRNVLFFKNKMHGRYIKYAPMYYGMVAINILVLLFTVAS